MRHRLQDHCSAQMLPSVNVIVSPVPDKIKDVPSPEGLYYIENAASYVIKKSRSASTANRDFFVTGDEGIEPPPKVLETPIIPLDQSPK